MKQLITRSQLADRAGVTRGAITNQCAKGKPLAPACVEDKIDAGHPAVQKYLKNKGVDPTFTPEPELEHEEIEGFPDDGTAKTLVKLGGLTLDDIETRFGGIAAFDNWLKILKTKEEIREKRLKNEATESAVISRELVETYIFGLLEELSRKLLADTSRTLARRVYSAAQANVSLEESEQIIRELISGNLQRAQQQAGKRLEKF